LDEGWNQIQFNLSDFTRRAYGTNYIETLRVQIHANCRIRRIYFSDRLYSEDELPPEFKLFLPLPQPKGGANTGPVASSGGGYAQPQLAEQVEEDLSPQQDAGGAQETFAQDSSGPQDDAGPPPEDQE